MADYQHILLEIEDGVAVITMNRPEVLNAMNRKLCDELHETVLRLAGDDDVGCIVITGAGEKAFSAGGDIHEQRSDDARYGREEVDRMNAARGPWNYEISACA